MAIPNIPPYRLPLPSELPANKASWRPEAGRCALLIHDMQRYFLSAFTAGAPPLPDLLFNIGQIRRLCRQRDVPVIYTAQPGGQSKSERGLLWDFWGAGLGLEAAALIDELAPEEGDTIVRKSRYSAFFRTQLAQTLVGVGRDQLIICGVYGHIGCLVTATDAFMADLQPFLVADAVADFSAAHHAMALRYAAERCAVVLPTAALLDSLTRTGRGRDQAGTPGEETAHG
jgi:bifunctional isochorismate lyase / aryl carrier protein